MHSKKSYQSELEEQVLSDAGRYFDIYRNRAERLFGVDISEYKIEPHSEHKKYIKQFFNEAMKGKIEMNILEKLIFQITVEMVEKYHRNNSLGVCVEGRIYINEKLMVAKYVDSILRDYHVANTVLHEVLHAVHDKTHPFLKDLMHGKNDESLIITKTFTEGFATYMSSKIMVDDFLALRDFKHLSLKNEGSFPERTGSLMSNLHNDSQFYTFLRNKLLFASCKVYYSEGFKLFNEVDCALGFDGILKALKNPPASLLHINYPKVYVEYLRRC